MLRLAVQRNHHQQGHARDQQQTADPTPAAQFPIHHHAQDARRIHRQNHNLDVAEAPGVRRHAEHVEEAHRDLAVQDGHRVADRQPALGRVAAELQHEFVGSLQDVKSPPDRSHYVGRRRHQDMLHADPLPIAVKRQRRQAAGIARSHRMGQPGRHNQALAHQHRPRKVAFRARSERPSARRRPTPRTSYPCGPQRQSTQP